MTNNSFNHSATRTNLQQLGVIRFIALGCQILALIYFSQVQPIGLPAVVLSVILALYALVIFLIWRRSFWQYPISEFEFFVHIIIDIVFFSALLFYSGGGTNPFVFYYLVPISVSAATLPRRYTLFATVISLTLYALLLQFHVNIPALGIGHGHHMGHSPNLHIIGMWFNFCLSAALITYFVTRMSSELRLQEQAIARHREDQLVDEQVMGIATLAAGTAHELGTPLNTMKILLEELKAAESNAQTQDDLAMLEQQLTQCRKTLNDLVKTASESTSTDTTPVAVNTFFDSLIERWQLLRPQTQLNLSIDQSAPTISAVFHPTISQALISLINNAADASPEKVDLVISWNETQATVTIQDYGPGISPDIQSLSAQPFTSSKPDGMGLGLFLTRATFNRFGGEVTLTNNSHGTLTIATFGFQS